MLLQFNTGFYSLKRHLKVFKATVHPIMKMLSSFAMPFKQGIVFFSFYKQTINKCGIHTAFPWKVEGELMSQAPTKTKPFRKVVHKTLVIC